jgi:mRNA interferase MazF
VHWVKADMLATVGFHRLNLIGIGRDQYGKRKYLTLAISRDDLENIRQCVLHALGMEA